MEVCTRKCKICGNIINYKTYGGWWNGNAYNRNCRGCATEKVMATVDFNGRKNPFYGQKHSQKTLAKISGSKHYLWKGGQKKCISCGKEKGWKGIRCKKCYIKDGVAKGKGNPMYGKPSPVGSGNGWGGWLDGIYFRSIHELSYLYYLIENKVIFENAEKKKFAIPYIDSENNQRNYFADYIVGKEIIEIKPLALINTKSNQSKIIGAKLWAKKHSMVYKIKTPQILELKLMKYLADNQRLKFLPKYQTKFKILCQN